MKKCICVSMAVIVAIWGGNSFAELTATTMPKNFQDVSFQKRNDIKAEGYEPYKDLKAYVVPELKDTDDEFKRQMCERDHDECCRRWPSYSGCQPSIKYELFGGTDKHCKDSTDPAKGTAPDIYYTNRGATVSCIPTRQCSKFIDWCANIDSLKKLKDCVMPQKIAVGEKNDKIFYAHWECEDTAKLVGQECVAKDPNMNDDCKCWGNMHGVPTDPSKPTILDKCECNADPAVAQINPSTHQCECIDPDMDIDTNCRTRKSPCSDPSHMDPGTCDCLPAGKTKNLGGTCQCVDKSGSKDPYQDIDDNCNCTVPNSHIDTTSGKCVCDDTSLDIADMCVAPPDFKYIIVQCRTDDSYVQDVLTNHRTAIVPVDKMYYEDTGFFDCANGDYSSLNDCFTPCMAPGYTGQGAVNKALPGFSFCGGRMGPRGEYGISYELRDPSDSSSYKEYTKAEADKFMSDLRAKLSVMRNNEFSDCDSRRFWYMIVFKYHNNKVQFYDIQRIGS